MCRLFGLTAGTARVKATFWLLNTIVATPGELWALPAGSPNIDT